MGTEMLKKKPGAQMKEQQTLFSEKEEQSISYGGNQAAMDQMQMEKLENSPQFSQGGERGSLLQGMDAKGLRPLSSNQTPVLQGKWNKPWRKKKDQPAQGSNKLPAQLPSPAQSVPPTSTQAPEPVPVPAPAPAPASTRPPDSPEVAAKKQKARENLNPGKLFSEGRKMGLAMGSLMATQEIGLNALVSISRKDRNQEKYAQALREGRSNPDFMEAMTAEAGNFFGEQLSTQEALAVLDYTAAQSGAYNAVGRNPEENHDESLKNKVGILSGALKKYTLEQPIQVYRYIGRPALAKMLGGGFKSYDLTVEAVNNGLIGSVIQEKGFMSTSVNPNLNWSGDVKMVIEVPAGAKGAPVMNMSNHANEDEYLFDMGAKMEILGASKDAHMLVLHCQMLKPSEGEERTA